MFYLRTTELLTVLTAHHQRSYDAEKFEIIGIIIITTTRTGESAFHAETNIQYNALQWKKHVVLKNKKAMASPTEDEDRDAGVSKISEDSSKCLEEVPLDALECGSDVICRTFRRTMVIFVTVKECNEHTGFSLSSCLLSHQTVLPHCYRWFPQNSKQNSKNTNVFIYNKMRIYARDSTDLSRGQADYMRHNLNTRSPEVWNPLMRSYYS